MDLKKDFQPLGSQTLLSMTQLWVCWTSRDPSLKQHENNNDSMDDFWQQVAKFVSNVSNLLFTL